MEERKRDSTEASLAGAAAEYLEQAEIEQVHEVRGGLISSSPSLDPNDPSVQIWNAADGSLDVRLDQNLSGGAISQVSEHFTVQKLVTKSSAAKNSRDRRERLQRREQSATINRNKTRLTC